MKKIITNLSIVVTLFLLCEKTSAQCSPINDILLSSQADISAFVTHYPNCTEIVGTLTIGDTVNASDITDISPLSNLTSVGHLIIANTQLTSLLGLTNITSINTGGLVVVYNDALTSIQGLENITSLQGQLLIMQNQALTSLSGLNNLTSVNGFGTISYNNALTSLSGLDNLTIVNGNNFSVVENNALTSLSALNSLTYVRWFNVYENPLLTSLSGLENIIPTEGFNVSNNSLLTDISALQNIDPTTTMTHPEYRLLIFDNPLLSVCNLPNICTYLQGIGDREVYGNAGDCIDEQAILNVCSLSVESNLVSEITVYPNPVSNEFTINIASTDVEIFDVSGKKVFEQKNVSSSINISHLSKGIYIVKGQTERGTFNIKIAKQ